MKNLLLLGTASLLLSTSVAFAADDMMSDDAQAPQSSIQLSSNDDAAAPQAQQPSIADATADAVANPADATANAPTTADASPADADKKPAKAQKKHHVNKAQKHHHAKAHHAS